MNWTQRQRKDNCRSLAVLNRTGKPIKHGLFFPSNEMLCLKEAISKGLVNNKTVVESIERKREIFKQQKHLTDKTHLYQVNIDTDSQKRKFVINQIHVDGKLDYAFFDLCGTLTQSRFEFIQQLEFTSDATICFTFDISGRSRSIQSIHPWYEDQIVAKKKLYGLSNLVTLRKDVTKETIFHLALVKKLFDKFELQEAIEYRDSTVPMVFFKIQLK